MGKGENEELTNTERLRKENMKVIELRLSFMLSVKLENQKSRLCLVLEK